MCISQQADFVAVADYVDDAVFRMVFLTVLALFQNVCDGSFQFDHVKNAEIGSGDAARAAGDLLFRLPLKIGDTVLCETDVACRPTALAAERLAPAAVFQIVFNQCGIQTFLMSVVHNMSSFE